MRTASVLEDFYRINGFLKNSKKALILGTFSEAEAEKNQEKIVLRNMRFSDIDFLKFFLQFLAILLGFWEAPGPQKFEKNPEKNRKNKFSDAFSFEGGFWDGSGAVLGGF